MKTLCLFLAMLTVACAEDVLSTPVIILPKADGSASGELRFLDKNNLLAYTVKADDTFGRLKLIAGSAAGNNAHLVLDHTTGAFQSAISFTNAGVDKFQFGISTTDLLNLIDRAHSNRLVISTDATGNLFLMENAGADVRIGATTTYTNHIIPTGSGKNLGSTTIPFADQFFVQTYAETFRISRAGTSFSESWQLTGDAGQTNYIKLINTSGGIIQSWACATLPCGITLNGNTIPSSSGLQLGRDVNPWGSAHINTITMAGEIRFVPAIGDQYVGFRSHATAPGASITFRWPNADGAAGYSLCTDGALQFGWCAAGTGLPVVDTTAVVKGSVDATKLLRFEVDGFTTGITRVLTPQNADYTIASLELTQTISGANTFTAVMNTSSIIPTASGKNLGSTTIPFTDQFFVQTYAETFRISRAGTSFSESWQLTGDAAQANYIKLLNTSGATLQSWNCAGSCYSSLAGDFSPAISNTYALGAGSLKWAYAWLTALGVTSSIDVNGTPIVDSSRNLVNITALSMNGALTGATNVVTSVTGTTPIASSGGLTPAISCATCATTDTTQTISGAKTFSSASNVLSGSLNVTGNIYGRVFSGANADCSSVADGWFGFRTDTFELQVCFGGALKKIALA